MPLVAGHRLGPYEVVGPLGAGGMGEVYRARDTRLQRQVAIKIVPATVAADPMALARFEREAQAVAALSHPNILAIHDIGRDTGVSYAVMELLEGRSLADLIQTGPVPLRKALDYATQMANGLAAAHDRGIVHRDLKPSNVFVNADGRVTILDFGLAQLDALPFSDDASTAAPGTSPGMVLGTVGYMAPEQVRGQAVDHRTDIFAFGAVLYEMLSGRRAFARATAADTLGAILNADPSDLTIDGTSVPPALDRVIRRCLEKEPSQRFQSTRDLAFALDALSARSSTGASVAEVPTTAAKGWRLGLLPVGATCLLLGAALAWLATSTLRPANPGAATSAPPIVRFEMTVPLAIAPWLDVSPDGQSFIWGAVVPGSNTPEIWMRRLADVVPVRVPGAADARFARWRDDSRRLSVLRNGTWFSVDPTSGISTPHFEFPPEFRDLPLRGFAFARDDDALLAVRDGITRFRIGQSPAATEIAQPDRTVHDFYGFPAWLPDRSRILYMASRRGRTLEAMVKPIEGGQPVKLDLPVGISRVLVDPSGAIMYGLGGALLGQRFDFDTLKPIGEPVTIGTDVIMDRATGLLSADFSAAGVLAYRSGALAPVQFEWVDRAGRTVGTLGSPGPYVNFDLSSDNARVAVMRRPDAGSNVVWLLDDVRRTAAPIVDPEAGSLADPTWSPDGQSIAYRRGSTIVTRRAFGGEERKIADFAAYPDSWSRDGRYLAVGKPNAGLYELWAVRVDGTSEEIPLVQGLAVTDEPRFSPDGRWVAYHAVVNESPQIYAIPFPPTGETFQISAEGGVQPRWRGDGRELFFLDLKGRLMSVDVPGGDPTKTASPRALFVTGVTTSTVHDQFAPASDGQRFLIRRPVGGTEQQTVHVILNWRQLLQ